MKTVDIVERIEGEAKLVCSWENKKISDARIEFLNFRGFEFMLEGKSPLDALVYTPRICGICGQAHLLATVNALENIYENIGEKLTIPTKAKILREIGLNIEIIDSHIKWFYMFIMPDIVALSTKDYQKYAPLKGRKWIKAVNVASETIKALAIIGGQWPHTSYMIPGGVVSDPSLLDLTSMENYLDGAIIAFEEDMVNMDFDKYLSLSSISDFDKIDGDLKEFINLSFEHDFHNIGRSHDKHIAFGESSLFKSGKIKKRANSKLDLSKIEEHTKHTFNMKQEDDTSDSYTWAKSVTYNGEFYETGPLSRALIQNRKFIKEIHKAHKDSVMTRVMARVDELARLLHETKALIKKIDISEESYIKPKISLNDVDEASAKSVIEACRGSLYHDLSIKEGKISSYNVITPTVWNLGPQSSKELSVAQKAIIGNASLDIAKIVLRSFDVCSVCTTH